MMVQGKGLESLESQRILEHFWVIFELNDSK